MKQVFSAAAALLIAVVVAPTLSAEEKNGLSVNVTKRTLNRSDRRDSYSSSSFSRTQGYKLNLKNVSMKPFAEGEVTWTIVVRKTSTDRLEKFSGTEKLNPLRSSETVELMFGSVPVGGFRNDREVKDEMDYEVVVAHGGKETVRMSSTANFAALARHAIEEEGHGQAKAEHVAGGDVVPPTAVKPGAADVATIPGAPGAPQMPATPGTPMAPGAATAAPMTAATPATPAPAETAAAAPIQSFDFFNLKKKAP